MTPILSIVGRSNSGKTTLLEKLIRELTGRGRRIGTIKHHFHGPVEVDIPGKGRWYRVRLGSFDTREAAERYRRDLEEQTGSKGYVTGIN